MKGNDDRALFEGPTGDADGIAPPPPPHAEGGAQGSNQSRRLERAEMITGRYGQKQERSSSMARRPPSLDYSEPRPILFL